MNATKWTTEKAKQKSPAFLRLMELDAAEPVVPPSISAAELRQRLFDTFMDYARQAQIRREWEAASAYMRAADLALGTTNRVE